jgi:hypothetical protein
MPGDPDEGLLRQISELVESAEHLRDALARYATSCGHLAELVQQGTGAIEALAQIGAPQLRPELTDALDQFAGARHGVRVAVTATALREGASISDVGRALNISRQLAHRIANDVGRQPPGTPH